MRSYNKGKNHPKFKDLTGKRVGKLVVLNYVFHTMKTGRKMWLWECRCKCGNIIYTRTRALLKENPVSSCIECGYKRMAAKNTLSDNLSLQKRIFRNYKRGAKNRGYSWEISFEDFQSLIQKNCSYCNKEPQVNKGEEPYFRNEGFKRNGIDRRENSIGYTKQNVTTCCSRCNRMKLDMSEEEFLESIKNCYNYLFNKSSTTIPTGSTLQVNGSGNGNPSNTGEDIV